MISPRTNSFFKRKDLGLVSIGKNCFRFVGLVEYFIVLLRKGDRFWFIDLFVSSTFSVSSGLDWNC